MPTAAKAATIPEVSTINPTDEELLQRVGHRDGDAFETLYRRYSRSVLGLALRRLGDRGRAEDALQETFAAIWRAAKTYRPSGGRRARGSSPSRATASPTAAGRGASRRPRRRTSRRARPAPTSRPSIAGSSWRVHSAIETLPDNERRLIELAYWSGLSQSEIADLEGIPLGTVKTRTRSALARLADALEEELK